MYSRICPNSRLIWVLWNLYISYVTKCNPKNGYHMEQEAKKGRHMVWERPEVIDLSKEPDAEGLCSNGSVAGAACTSNGVAPAGSCIAVGISVV